MAIADLTGSIDGGAVLVVEGKEASLTPLQGIGIYWSLATNKSGKSGGELDFGNVRYPKDTRTDCWFCLASKCCEKHLIVSIEEESYVAMPKGPLNSTHALIVPVAHDGKGALCGGSSSSNDEISRTKDKLRALAASQGLDLFVFERAIETQGHFHAHLQCIPIEPKYTAKLATILASAESRLGFKMREVMNEEMTVKSLVGEENNGSGYFYLELPVGAETESDRGRYKRFIYVQSDLEKRQRSKIPIQLGRELVAMATDKREHAHWKACVLDDANEKREAIEFREKLQSLR
jgi:hypothetical protein